MIYRNFSALSHAVHGGHIEVQDINIFEKTIAIHFFCNNIPFCKVAEYLLSNGADPDITEHEKVGTIEIIISGLTVILRKYY